MKPIPDAVLDEIEQVACEGLKHIQAMFEHKGSDARFDLKAKVAIATLGAYGKLRASETGRMALELARERERREQRERVIGPRALPE